MTLLYSICKLVRLPNLIIVLLTQWFIYAYVLSPNFTMAGLISQLTSNEFGLLALITILLTAGGYIINDIEDCELDSVNKPDKVIVDKVISRSLAFWLYFGTLLLGFLLALFLAFTTSNVHLIFIYPLAAAGLFMYSMQLKKSFLAGNVLVAAYCAGVAGIIWVAERHTISELMDADPVAGRHIRLIFLVYMVLAFLSTLFREIIKDIEDLKGDLAYGSRTLPIVWGVDKAKRMSFGIGLALLLTIFFAVYHLTLLNSPLKVSFIILTMISPMILALTWLIRARSRKQYHRLSQLTKFLMVSGILLLLIISL